jgi:eukaryotic-like serine/threonine-protein kinase
MALAIGMRLGPYEILAPLGAGGMGEVYRARDTRLGREVAIKVLPAQHLGDPVRRQRFLREAQAVSALNHPNIVTLHDVGESGELSYLVMEHVRGRTLDQVIPREGLRLVDTLRIALQIADGLRNAHAAGILHRDLKPANVMVTEDGTAKLLDFGLAKLVQQEEPPRAGSPEGSTQSVLSPAAQDTAAGAIVGTVAYMSPEQAQGKALDARSDIFSFGAVLYEMVTGRRAFQGDSGPAILVAVIGTEPRPPRELVPEIPRDLERVILRCLRKDPARRFHDIADVKVELLELKEDSESQAAKGGAPAAAGGARRGSRRRRIVLAALGVALVAGAGVAAFWRARPPVLPPPSVVRLTSAQRVGPGSFSPDGTQIVFASAGDDGANWDIWLKIVGEAETRRLTTDAAPEGIPAWSPDGNRIAFLRYGGLPGSQSVHSSTAGAVHLVSPLGGPARRLSDFPVRGQVSWSPDSRWLAAAKARLGGDPPGGIYLIPAAGGGPRELTSPKLPLSDVAPAFSPDGRTLAYASCGGAESSPACDVYVLPLDADLRPRGAAQRLTQQGLWSQGLTWSRDGRSILYGAGGLWRVRADGSAPPERVEVGGPADHPSAARTRDRLAFHRGYWHVGIYRLQLGGAPTPLVESAMAVAEFGAEYSPDGQRIAFESNRGAAGDRSAIWLAAADGSNPTQLPYGPGRGGRSPRWSPDGRSIAFDAQAEDGRSDIWTIGVDGTGLRQVTRHPADEQTSSWSRDGHFLYFSSNRTGRREVFRVAATGGPEEQLTHEGGCNPHESRDGQTLYYMKLDSDAPLLARPTGGGEERVIVPCVSQWSYAVGPEGVFHVDCSAPDVVASRRVLRHLNTSTGEDRPVATFEADFLAGLSASPDGRTIVYGRSPWGTGDLMMIDNFR